MANITKQLEFIKTAQYGRDVRQSIYEAIEAVNSGAEGSAAAAERSKTAAETAKAGAESSAAAAERSKTAAETAKAGAESSAAAAERSKTAAETAKAGAESSAAAAERSKTAAETAKVGAEGSAAAAERSKTAAETAQIESQENAKMSESWARGSGGEVREGDETDNSEFYSRQSHNSAELSKYYYQKTKQTGDNAINAINNAMNNINQGLPRFVINPKDGKLYCTPSRFTFVINRLTGNLEWGLTL